MTTAPGLTMSPLMSPGTPAAATSTSAERVMSAIPRVNLFVEITVASARIMSTAMGFPTMFDAPTITQREPRSSTPVDSIISTDASAVQGTRLRRP